ncbi:MAG: putative toxin-antitoxin system toxin component, PIN family [Myxococcota bacterium]|nr:putative toxin-antitoxin system toxin component, PIN family [Myxococcota bacterium]
MIKAVFDTNIFVSALIKPKSTPAKLLDMAAKAAFELVVSSQIIAELDTVLSYPKISKHQNIDDKSAEVFLGLILKTYTNIGNVPQFFIVPNDPRDNHVISTAITCRADYLVSGDKAHILPLGSVEGTKIVTANEFFELISSGEYSCL